MQEQSKPRGCLMCDSLYVKANGELPCWDDVGESRILRTLTEAGLIGGRSGNIFSSPELVHIRRSFMEGKDPDPDLCRLCAVRNHGGIATTVKPERMRILHIEASYLCHLSCPQCIPAKARHDLKGPPYNMTVATFVALLRQLRREGIRHISVVHFEGRGDPLVNPELSEMIAATRREYPGAFTMATTHGSYRYREGFVESGLDSLRVSIDGAFPENYRKYRVGGDLERVFEFLGNVKAARLRSGSHLKVEWKYILFEWNDSDEELRHAARIAEDLHVQLNFVLTHSPGRSTRFRGLDDLSEHLSILAPKATCGTTFPLREPSAVSVEDEMTYRATISVESALERIRAGDETLGFALLKRGLEYDSGIRVPERYGSLDCLLRRYVPRIINRVLVPNILNALVHICQNRSDNRTAMKVLRRYRKVVADEAAWQYIDQVLADSKWSTKLQQSWRRHRSRWQIRPHWQRLCIGILGFGHWLRARLRVRTRIRMLLARFT